MKQGITRRGFSMAAAGGLAALVKAVTYIAGFGLMGAYLVPEGFGDGDPSAAGRRHPGRPRGAHDTRGAARRRRGA